MKKTWTIQASRPELGEGYADFDETFDGTEEFAQGVLELVQEDWGPEWTLRLVELKQNPCARRTMPRRNSVPQGWRRRRGRRRRQRSQAEQIAFANRVYKREMDIIMAWLKANDLDYEIRLYTKPEYEKKEGRGAAHGASLILQGEANTLITVLNTTEPLDYYEELNDAFLALLQGRDVGFGPDAGYELLNHYTIGIYEVL